MRNGRNPYHVHMHGKTRKVHQRALEAVEGVPNDQDWALVRGLTGSEERLCSTASLNRLGSQVGDG